MLESVIRNDDVDRAVFERQGSRIVEHDGFVDRRIGRHDRIDVGADDLAHLALDAAELTTELNRIVDLWCAAPGPVIEHDGVGMQDRIDALIELDRAVNAREAARIDLGKEHRADIRGDHLFFPTGVKSTSASDRKSQLIIATVNIRIRITTALTGRIRGQSAELTVAVNHKFTRTSFATLLSQLLVSSPSRDPGRVRFGRIVPRAPQDMVTAEKRASLVISA